MLKLCFRVFLLHFRLSNEMLKSLEDEGTELFPKVQLPNQLQKRLAKSKRYFVFDLILSYV